MVVPEVEESKVQPLSTVFILCPFHEPFNTYYEKVYKPAIQAAGRNPLRADSIFRSGNVVRQVWEFILESEVVLAELSEENPNVYYELGLAHAVGKPTILATSVPDAIPFDLRNLRHLVYDTRQPDWAAQLQMAIAQTIEETARRPAGVVLPELGLTAIPFPRNPTGPREGSEDSGVEAGLAMLHASIDSLRQEVSAPRSPTPNVPDSQLGADGLVDLATALLVRGFSKREVVDELRARGAPGLWATHTVDQLRSQT